jgi:hypothetical protein
MSRPVNGTEPFYLTRDIIGTNGRLRWDRIVPIMSLLRQNIPVLLNGLDIIIMLLTD